MSIKTKLLSWFVPSKWVEAINGSKTLLGLIAFLLWGAIYAVPALCQETYCAAIAAAGAQIHEFLLAAGINLSAELLNLASILIFVGLADKLVQKKITKVILGIFRLIEAPIAKLIEKGETKDVS
jgi:hypothetical protein